MRFTPAMSVDPSRAPRLGERVYTPQFWLAYLANLLLVCANSLTFRFADYVEFLGGNKTLTGQLFQAGMLAAITFRLMLGRAMDRYGTRRIWLASSGLFLAGVGTYLCVGRLSVFFWLARVLHQVGLAGMFSCSIVHIQDRVPHHRRTEVIGSLGSSGFVGTILGTSLGDLVFWLFPQGNAPFLVIFLGSLLLGTVHVAVVLRLTRRDLHQPPEVSSAPWVLLWRHWPGSVALVSLAMGTSFAVTTLFLTRYAGHLALRGIGMFFLPYSLTAFGCRWMIRDWGTTFGRHKMILWGLAGLTVGQLLFLPVKSDLWFILPGMVCGFGHALLFPAVVSLGAGKFPIEYRGTGTTLVLGFQEIGMALSAPLLGMIVDHGQVPGASARAGFVGMFLAASATAAAAGIVYLLTAARTPDAELMAAVLPNAEQTAPINAAGNRNVADAIVLPVE
jgi:MFS family permease